MLSQVLTDSMLRPRVSQKDGKHEYAFGWDTFEGPDNRRIVAHSGGNPYFGAHFQWHVDHDLLVFVASNNPDQLHFGRLSEHMASLAVGDTTVLPPALTAVDTLVLASQEHAFRLASGGSISIRLGGAGLTLTADRGDDAIQFVLGGMRGSSDASVSEIAGWSQKIFVQEYEGELHPKFEAMRGTTTIRDLERFRRFDVEYWNEHFGRMHSVVVVAAAGERDVVEVILRPTFERGAAAITHTWRDGRLANISVTSDWEDYTLRRRIYPVGASTFESYSHAGSLRVRLDIQLVDGRLAIRSRTDSMEARQSDPTGDPAIRSSNTMTLRGPKRR